MLRENKIQIKKVDEPLVISISGFKPMPGGQFGRVAEYNLHVGPYTLRRTLVLREGKPGGHHSDFFYEDKYAYMKRDRNDPSRRPMIFSTTVDIEPSCKTTELQAAFLFFQETVNIQEEVVARVKEQI